MLKHRLFFIFLAAVVLTGGCASLRQTPEEKARMAQLVDQRLNDRCFRIDIDYMTPRRSSGKAVTSSYSITVDGNVIDSHLPYVGVAYSVPYGGGKVLTFKDEIDEYADSGWQKDGRTIVFATDNDEDLIVYRLTVYENGRAYLDVRCRNREDISYRGSLNPDNWPQE